MNSKEINDTGIRTTLAFYGIKNSDEAIDFFYTLVVNYFTGIGCAPTNTSVTGAGFAKGNGRFSSKQKQLQKRGFRDVEEMDIFATDDASNREVPDRLTDATISRRADTYAIASIPTVLLDAAAWREFTLSILHILRPAYGIEYDRHFKGGPVLFALGIGYDDSVEDVNVNETEEEYEAARNRSRWMDMAMPRQLYRQGVIRDVYRRNFLNESHLSRTVDGVTLKKWIATDPARGTLAQACDGVWAWDVDESKIDEVRKPLKELIFNWRNFA